ncbi:MAG: alpha/beta fold hydrolase [Candidatus Heimdallarchaeota archaeon]|nr:alpha/beta fold hydrolase [Candidatus Heimdallarchaeota archaeon]
MHDVNPLALPFEFKGPSDRGKVGCLLLHSFTTSPSEVRPLGIYLRNLGYSGIAPLLPGHGSVPEDLGTTTWLDWYAVARDSLIYLKESYENVFVLGVALGSVLATILAASHLRENIAGLILISPSQHAPSTLVKNLLPFVKHFKKDFPMEQEQVTTELRDKGGQFFYSKRPTTSLIEMYRVIGFTNHRLANITQPTLVINTETADGATDFIFEKLIACEKKKAYTMVTSSPRWFLLEEEGKPAFLEIDGFIQSVLDGSLEKYQPPSESVSEENHKEYPE